MWANQSRDAKFCVSQARMRNKQMRNMPAIAALFARETQGWAINKCDYAPVITAFFARETQGGAINKCEICLSLPRFLLGRRKILRLYWADAIIILIQKNMQTGAIVFCTYPHPLFPIQQPFSFHSVLTPHPLYVKNRHKM